MGLLFLLVSGKFYLPPKPNLTYGIINKDWEAWAYFRSFIQRPIILNLRRRSDFRAFWHPPGEL